MTLWIQQFPILSNQVERDSALIIRKVAAANNATVVVLVEPLTTEAVTQSDEIAQSTMLIEEFFLYALENNPDFIFENAPKNQNAVLHGHCHQKALVGTEAAMKVLEHIPGLHASEVKSGCCGMAGSFGYLKNHYEISMQIGEETLFPKLRAEQEDTLVITEGVSCSEQIEQGSGRTSKHLVQVIADYI